MAKKKKSQTEAMEAELAEVREEKSEEQPSVWVEVSNSLQPLWRLQKYGRVGMSEFVLAAVSLGESGDIKIPEKPNGDGKLVVKVASEKRLQLLSERAIELRSGRHLRPGVARDVFGKAKDCIAFLKQHNERLCFSEAEDHLDAASQALLAASSAEDSQTAYRPVLEHANRAAQVANWIVLDNIIRCLGVGGKEVGVNVDEQIASILANAKDCRGARRALLEFRTDLKAMAGDVSVGLGGQPRRRGGNHNNGGNGHQTRRPAHRRPSKPRDPSDRHWEREADSSTFVSEMTS